MSIGDFVQRNCVRGDCVLHSIQTLNGSCCVCVQTIGQRAPCRLDDNQCNTKTMMCIDLLYAVGDTEKLWGHARNMQVRLSTAYEQ